MVRVSDLEECREKAGVAGQVWRVREAGGRPEDGPGWYELVSLDGDEIATFTYDEEGAWLSEYIAGLHNTYPALEDARALLRDAATGVDAALTDLRALSRKLPDEHPNLEAAIDNLNHVAARIEGGAS